MRCLQRIVVVLLLFLPSAVYTADNPDHVKNKIKKPWKWGNKVNEPKNRPQCVSKKCKLLQDEVKDSMNSKANPCKDWSEYVCGNYATQHQLHWDFKVHENLITWETRTHEAIKELVMKYLTGFPFKVVDKDIFKGKPPPGIDEDLFGRMRKYWNGCIKYWRWQGFSYKSMMPIVDEIHASFRGLESTKKKDQKDDKKDEKEKDKNEDEDKDDNEDEKQAHAPKSLDLFDYEMIQQATEVISRYSIWAFARFTPERSLFDASKMRVRITPQVPNGMPSLEAYKNKGFVKMYKASMRRWFLTSYKQAGYEKLNLKKTANAVFDLELKLLEMLPEDYELKQFKNYKLLALEELRALIPELSLDEVIARQPGVTMDLIDKVEIQIPDYWKKLSTLLAKTPMDTIRAYFIWRFFLSTYFLAEEDTDSIDYGHLLNKLNGQEEAWENLGTCRKQLAYHFGPLMDAIFMNLGMHPDNIKYGKSITEAVRYEFRKQFEATPWMDNQTRAKFIEKLDNITYDVAIPSAAPNIVDMEAIRQFYIDAELMSKSYSKEHSHAIDYLNFENWYVKKRWEIRLRRPPAPTPWDHHTHNVGSSYNYQDNIVQLSGGLMTGWFWDPDNLPTYVQFANFGVYAARETARAFGIEGSQISVNGTVDSLFASLDAKLGFNEQVQCYMDQYDGMDVEGNKINGKRVISQAMADSIGLDAAFYAWQRNEQSKGEVDSWIWRIPQFTNEKMFFILRSMWFCSKERLGYLKSTFLHEDEYLPYRTRVWAPLQNSQAWHEAFDCKPQKPMCRLFNKTVN